MIVVLLAAVAAVAAVTPASIDDAEGRRLRAHFDTVLAEMAARDVSDLPPSARLARARQMDELARYRDAGTFPQNWRTRETTPIFVDDDGRACAVAHLLLVDGQTDFVAAVVATQNLAFVPDITVPGLAAWAGDNGVTVAELARIQPSYPARCGDIANCVSTCCAGKRCMNFNAHAVCGDDGVTYGSEDIAESCDAKVVGTGACPAKAPVATTGCAAGAPSIGVGIALLALLRRRRQAAAAPLARARLQ